MTAGPSDEEILEVGSEPLSSNDERLERLFDEMEKDSLKTLEDAARLIITLCTTLLTAFFALLALKDGPSYLDVTGIKILAALAMGGFFAALFFALDAVLPRKYTYARNDLTGKRYVLQAMLSAKRTAVSRAMLVFGAGVLLMLLTAVIALFFYI